MTEDRRQTEDRKIAFWKKWVGIFLLFITACGGGGGDSSSTSSSSTITYSGTEPGSNAVYMIKNDELSGGNIIALDVKVNNISENVFGAAFDLDFDSSALTYHGFEAGNFLESRGSSVNYMAALESGSSDKLIVGISIQGAASGVSGSGTLVTLKFDAVGDSSLSFSNTALKDSSNQAISGITWNDGTVYID